ncbi:MAG: response regulator, partial [Bradymonadaceae bacterium]
EERADGQVTLHFAISDTGGGIPPDKQEVIFEAFRQADPSATRRHGGTGLGLTIASQLVGLMGGDIWLDSEPGVGSTFHFTATFKVGRESFTEDSARVHTLEEVRVLVVDDNFTNRKFFGEMLQSWGMKPTMASTGEEALDLLDMAEESDDFYELILSDVDMPTMTGTELARHIHERRVWRNVPIMLLSSAEIIVHAEEMVALGITHQLLKPVRPSSLMDAISQALQLRVAVEKEPGPGPVEHPLRILLAEDNPINQRVATGLLEKRGHDVIVAKDGQEAVDILAEDEGFDLVLMDIQMPRMDGYQATAAIRERERTRGGHIPIIALTAHAMEGDRERILDAGMDAYLPKPVEAHTLYTIVEELDLSAELQILQHEGEGEPPQAPLQGEAHEPT